MDIFEQKQVLDTMEILVDTREQNTERARNRYESFGLPYMRATLNYCDYAYNATLPDGRKICDTSETVSPVCAIERKMSLDELAACLGSGRRRFEDEFQRARDHNARIFLICENATWENLLNGKYRSRLHPNAFKASLIAWAIRYDIGLYFCKAESSGKLIREILYRDLKERLEKGEYG